MGQGGLQLRGNGAGKVSAITADVKKCSAVRAVLGDQRGQPRQSAQSLVNGMKLEIVVEVAVTGELPAISVLSIGFFGHAGTGTEDNQSAGAASCREKLHSKRIERRIHLKHIHLRETRRCGSRNQRRRKRERVL